MNEWINLQISLSQKDRAAAQFTNGGFLKRVALTGAHGVGKTTLATLTLEKLSAQGLKVLASPEIPRVICGRMHDPTFFRQEKNTVLKQFLLLYYQVQTELLLLNQTPTADFLICDRALLDHWAYTKYFYSEMLATEGLLELCEGFVAEFCHGYDILAYIPIEFAPEDDGIRESDDKFQKDVDLLIWKFLERHRLPYVVLNGPPEQRYTALAAALQV